MQVFVRLFVDTSCPDLRPQSAFAENGVLTVFRYHDADHTEIGVNVCFGDRLSIPSFHLTIMLGLWTSPASTTEKSVERYSHHRQCGCDPV